MGLLSFLLCCKGKSFRQEEPYMTMPRDDLVNPPFQVLVANSPPMYVRFPSPPLPEKIIEKKLERSAEGVDGKLSNSKLGGHADNEAIVDKEARQKV